MRTTPTIKSRVRHNLRGATIVIALAVNFTTAPLWCQPSPVIASFTASPAVVNPGIVTQLSWSVNNATTIAIDQSVGDLTGTTSIYVAPVQTTTYTLTASAGAASATKQVTVTVVDTPPPVFGAGRTFYVSPSGSDSNDGLSSASPWQTVAKVNRAALLPGDNVLFQRGGQWYESLTAPASGVAGNPISFADYGAGPKPKFWGSNVLTNYLFVPAGNGLYTYPISTPVTAALVNHTFFLTSPTGNAADLVNSWSYSGTTLTISSPNSDPRVNGYVYTAVVRQDAIFSNYMSHLVFRNLVVDETAAANQGYGIRIQNSTDVLVDSCEAYRAGKHHIASINSTQFVGANLYAAWAMPGQSRVGASSIDPGVSAYVAFGDNTVSLPNQTSVWRNSVWDHPIDPQNPLNYYAFFTHGPNITSVLLDNMSSLGANLTINNSDNPSAQIVVKGGLIQNARLEAYGQSTLVDGTLITGPNGSLRMGGTNSTFQNILLEGSYPEADGYQSAAVSLAAGNTLRFSTIVLDPRAAQSYSCLTLDSNYSGTSSQGAHFQYYANICATPSTALKQWDSYSVAADFAQSQYNLYPAGVAFAQAGSGAVTYLNFSQWQSFGADTASVQGNPLFVNAALGNYNLQSASPAIGAVPLPASLLTANPPIPTDQAGNPRLAGTAFDMGALAFQATRVPPGWSVSAVGGTPQTTAVNTEFGAPLQAKVLDSSGTAVIGVSVIFNAPSGGATASFSGSATGTALTDSNGIATSAALIAGAQQGSYSVTATTTGASAPANFSLTNTLVATGGVLSGLGNSATATDNLTAEGNADWVHWGDALLNRKMGVTPQIGTYTVVGSGPVMSYDNDPRALSWTDGTPTANGSNNDGVYINSLQNGFSFAAPADTSTRTLIVHVGGWLSGGTLTAHLSDRSAPDFVDTTSAAGGQYDRNYTLTYAAASSGQTLTISWVATSGGGNVTLNGAALSVTIPSILATAGTPQSTVVGATFTTALQATVKDANNNPVSGVTVTFSAPSTGAAATFSGSPTATVITNASGIATAPALTANSQPGTYTVTASAAGVGTPAGFSLTNLAGPPASIVATAGSSQSATVSTAFTAALQATVKDSGNNPVSGVTVTFTAPSTGTSATFSGSATATVITNASGIATAPTLTANGQTGSYFATAAVAGIGTPASFALTNTAAVAVSVMLVQQAAGSNTGNNQNTLTVTLPNAPGSGNVLILFFDQVGASQTITAISGATWTRLAQNYAGNIGDSEIWVGTNPTSSTVTITGTNYFGSFQPGYAIVGEFTGIGVALDGAPLNTTGGVWPVTTGSLVTANPGDLLLTSALSYNGGGASASVLSPWTPLSPSGATYSLAAAYRIVTAPGSYSAVWNGSGSPQVATIVLALKTVGGSGSIGATAGTPQSTTVNLPFPTALQATVTDSAGHPVSGASVTFTAPATGAGAAFSGSPTSTATTNAAGVATAPVLTANSQAGSYTVTAAAAGVGTPATFSLTNLAGAPASVTATAGTPQSATVSMAFATALQATVKDGNNNPVSGVTVTFTAPATGATATFSGSHTATAITTADGIATAPALTANNQVGGYTVTAGIAGVSVTVSFALSNIGAPPATIVPTAGTPQSATVTTAFPAALQATVKDANNNPVSGVTVTFTAPSTGAGATFSGSPTATAVTNANGIATAPTLTADSQAGSYTVTAAVAGVGTPASFSLTNLAGVPSGIAAIAGTPQSTTVGTAFTTALQATVKDSGNNPVSGVSVTFAAPSTGASATFSGSITATVTTNASGIAIAPTLTANSQTGSYIVTAAAAGIGTPASFALTNTATQAVSAMLVQQAAGSNTGNNQNTLTVTLGSAPGAGNVLILFFDQVGASQTITSITGATWTRLAQNYTGNIGDSEIWVGTNPTSSTVTITGTNYFGTFQPGYAIVGEFTGIGTTPDGAPLNTSGGIWPVTTGSLGVGNPGDLLITSALSYSGGGAQATVSNPWTPFTPPGGTYSLSAAYRIASGAGTYAATWNGSGSPQVSTVIVALKTSGSN